MMETSHDVYVNELIAIVERIRFCDGISTIESAATKMKLWWYAQKLLKAWCDERTIPLIPEDILQNWEMRRLQEVKAWKEK